MRPCYPARSSAEDFRVLPLHLPGPLAASAPLGPSELRLRIQAELLLPLVGADLRRRLLLDVSVDRLCLASQHVAGTLGDQLPEQDEVGVGRREVLGRV